MQSNQTSMARASGTRLVFKEPGDGRLASDTGCLLSLLPCGVAHSVSTPVSLVCKKALQSETSRSSFTRLMSRYMLQSVPVKPCFDLPDFAA